jgi:hypothetical protein
MGVMMYAPAPADAESPVVPANEGSYRLHVLDLGGNKLGESAALVRVN